MKNYAWENFERSWVQMLVVYIYVRKCYDLYKNKTLMRQNLRAF